MPKRLVVLNVAFVLVSAALAGYIVRELTTRHRIAAPGRPGGAAATATVPAVPTAEASAPIPPAAYAMVASRNLFSPSRTETPVATASNAAAALPKPALYGVVLREGSPVAYLEDPATKRVAGYRLGDNIAGGTLKSIDADHVVLQRPEGVIDVSLRDPSRPKPAAPATPGASVPGAPGTMPGTMPGTIPGPMPGVMPSAPSVPGGFVGPNPGGMPSAPQPPTVMPQVQGPDVQGAGRRPLPPSVLRRFPQAPTPNEAAR